MPSTLGVRNLSLCFSKIKQASAVAHNSPPLSPTAISTPDEYNHHRPLPTTATSSPSIFIKNFNSLYDNTFDYSSSSSLSTVANEPEPEPADFATAFSSQRFFFSSPGRSNSIIESTNIDTSLSSLSLSSSTTEVPINGNNSNKFFNDSVAVQTYSPDPYSDFRRSMQEMVEARGESMDVKSNWELLNQLLLCYLAINPKSTHKFILGAFADLLVSLM